MTINPVTLEEWADIDGYVGLYQVSNLGRVKSLPRYVNRGNAGSIWYNGHILKPNKNRNGEVYYSLSKNGDMKSFTVHRLVAKAFIPNPYGLPQINHIDGDRENNMVSNLEWCTASYNSLHKYRVLGHRSNGGVARKKIVLDDGTVYASMAEAARGLGVCVSSVRNCIRKGQKYTCCGHHMKEVT